MRWSPTCLGILEASQQGREDADSLFQHTNKTLTTHSSAEKMPVIPRAQKMPAEPRQTDPGKGGHYGAHITLCSQSSPTGPNNVYAPQPYHWHATCAIQWPMERQGNQPQLTTRSCRRLGLPLPKALTGNSEWNILFLSKGVWGRRAPAVYDLRKIAQ